MAEKTDKIAEHEVVQMFDPAFLEETQRLEARWREDFNKIASRFGVDPATYQTYSHSGLPLKPVYFPQDVAHIAYEDIGSPGIFPYTRGLLAAQYQFMPWANQPVMGYGLPEETRERMDYLRSQGMTGYFGKTFYNLVYDLVSHEGVDPDHPAAKGRVGQCGMAVYSRRDMARLFDGLDLTQMNVSKGTSNSCAEAKTTAAKASLISHKSTVRIGTLARSRAFFAAGAGLMHKSKG